MRIRPSDPIYLKHFNILNIHKIYKLYQYYPVYPWNNINNHINEINISGRRRETDTKKLNFFVKHINYLSNIKYPWYTPQYPWKYQGVKRTHIIDFQWISHHQITKWNIELHKNNIVKRERSMHYPSFTFPHNGRSWFINVDPQSITSFSFQMI